MAVGRAGMLADNGPRDVLSRVNPVVAIPFGSAVCRGVDPDRDVKLPTTAAEAAACIGIAVVDLATETQNSVTVGTYPVGSDVSVLRKGRVYVLVTEAVAAGNDVFVRYGDGVADTDGSDDAKGGFSDTADGVAQVATLTPTATNTDDYSVTLSGKKTNGDDYSETYSYKSDGDATASEIVAGLLAKINASTVVPVTATGSATLILTADSAGNGFVVNSTDNLAIAATTPNSGSAARLSGAKFMTSAAEGSFAVVEFNLDN